MADVAVDRLVVLIEAQTRSFEAQIKRLEGQIKGSSTRMASSFKGVSAQVLGLGKSFGIAGLGGIGGKAGVAAAMYATYSAADRAARAMGNLGDAIKRTGIAFDQSKLGDAQAWADDWESAGDRVNVVLSKLFTGQYSMGDFFSGKIKTELQPGTAQHVVGTRGDLGEVNDAQWKQIQADLELLDKSLAKLRDAANDAAQGMTDSVQSFTHAIIDNPKDWASALSNMLKGATTDIVDAGLFGSGPYAKILGTAGPSGGGPGGLIGDAFGALMGGGRDFGKPVPVEVVGVSGAGTVSGLLGGGAGGKDMMSRILGGDLTGPYTATGWPGLGGPPSAAATAANAAATSGIPFLNMIASAEGTAGPNGYNTSLGYGKFLPGGTEQNLTSMTLDQIRTLQTSMLNNPANTFNSSAIGRYQITRSTLDDLRTKLGLSGSELYDPQMQDALALNLAQQRGASGLSSTWAGIAQQGPGFLASLLAMFPHFASGGSISGPAIVGERGPEVFIPRVPGTIVPNGGGMGGLTIIDQRTNAPPIKQRGNTFFIHDHDRLMRDRYGVKPVQIGRT